MNLKATTLTYLAIEETGGDKSPHKAELEEEAEQAIYEFNATEEQIEKALSDVGASKLYVDVEANAEALMLRATSVESWNKTLHIEAWDDPMEPMDKMSLLPYYSHFTRKCNTLRYW